MKAAPLRFQAATLEHPHCDDDENFIIVGVWSRNFGHRRLKRWSFLLECLSCEPRARSRRSPALKPSASTSKLCASAPELSTASPLFRTLTTGLQSHCAGSQR
jgi:hypothetical protein